MKKILVLALAVVAMLAVPQQSEAQAFLNKMKEKAQQAQQAASGMANKMMEGTKVGDVLKSAKSAAERQEDNSYESGKSYGGDSHAAETSDEVSVLNTSKKANELQRQTNHVGNWDDALVTPSTAKFPVPLMNELPAVPSVEEIANPTEAAQKEFYMAIQKVALRAQALSEDETCDKAQEDLFFSQYKEKTMKIYGLNEREYGIYIGEIEASEEEQKRVVNKVLGFDVENVMAAFDDVANMSDAEREKKAAEMQGQMTNSMVKGVLDVCNKYPTELKKYFNMTPEDMAFMMSQSMGAAQSGNEKAAEAMSKTYETKVREHQKTLSAADQKAAKEFEAKFQTEVQAATRESFRSASPLGNMMANVMDSQKRREEANSILKKREEYEKAISSAIPDAAFDGHKDFQFAASERKKVENLKAQIFATDDPNVYNPLYLQAIDIIKSYRVRAARVWHGDVERRLNNIKSSLPGIIKTNRQAIADEIIPECMLYRAPLNMVLQACETLEDAYTEVPVEYPALYQAEVVRQVKISSDEQVWWPEFYVAQTVSNILSGKTIFKSSNGTVYQFNAGKWVNAENLKTNAKAIQGETKAKSQKWTSSDGKRTVTYVEEGGYFLLPEGDIIEPRAIEKQGNNLVWAEIIEDEDDKGNTVIKIVKCTYKL